MRTLRASIALLVVLGGPSPAQAAEAQEDCLVGYFACITRVVEGAYGPADDCLAEYYLCLKRRVMS